jgi:hypothetical protein
LDLASPLASYAPGWHEYSAKGGGIKVECYWTGAVRLGGQPLDGERAGLGFLLTGPTAMLLWPRFLANSRALGDDRRCCGSTYRS